MYQSPSTRLQSHRCDDPPNSTAAGRTAARHARPQGPLDRRLGARRPDVLEQRRLPRRRRNLYVLDLLRAHRLLGLDVVVGAGAVPRPRLRHRPGRQVPAHDRPGGPRLLRAVAVHVRRGAPSAAGTGRSSAPRCCSCRRSLAPIVLEPGVSYSTLLDRRLRRRRRRRQLRLVDDQHQRLLPARSEKGWALGLNAGGGNLGVAAVQLLGLLVLATAGAAHPRVLIGIYIPLIVVAALGAYLFMDNLTSAKNDKRAMRDATRDSHTWIISFLYIGTFGSFIGFGFAFGQVLQVQFKADFPTPVKAAYLTFLGPLLGSLIRPVGGEAGRPDRRRERDVLELRRDGRERRRWCWRRRWPSRCRCSSPASRCCSSSAGSATARPTR